MAPISRRESRLGSELGSKLGSGVAALMAGVALVVSSAMGVPAQADARLQGGPKGVVKSSKGEMLEGMMVQLIAQKNAVRTTVYTNADGRYEFPALEAGTYTLRIALPREFKPFVKEQVEIKGASALADITLEYVTDSDLLPPRPEIAAQMTGSTPMCGMAACAPLPWTSISNRSQAASIGPGRTANSPTARPGQLCMP